MLQVRTGTRLGATPEAPSGPTGVAVRAHNAVSQAHCPRKRAALWPTPYNLRRLSTCLAFFHEAGLGRTGELLAVGADSLGFARVMTALLHERRLCGARECFAVL